MTLTQDEFQCERCGGVFKKGWSDEERDAEAKADPYGFQTPPPENPDIASVCEDCFQEMRVWIEAHGGLENAMACRCPENPDCPVPVTG